MKVNEIFYSLQGEGVRAGEPSIFIRLQGCKTKFVCASIGVKCDTEFESGKEWSIDELAEYLKRFPCKNIVWTGGEPTDQITEGIIDSFKQRGYYQCIETSGLNPVPYGIDFITLSPKVAEHILERNFPNGVNEIKYIRHKGQEIPCTKIVAQYYLLSPHSSGFIIDADNLRQCIDLCLKNPPWRLSIQQHKLWDIL